MSDELRQQWEYRGSGLMVTAVAPGSPAELAGITPGDLLVIVGSVTLRKEQDLAKAKSRVDTDAPVSVVVERNHGRVIKIIRLEPVAPPVEDRSAASPEGQSPSVSTAQAAPISGGAPQVEVAPGAGPVVKLESPPASPRDPLSILGVQGTDLNHDLAAALNVPADHGVLVLQVMGGAPGDRVGIKAGDVIVRAGDQAVESVEGLGQVLEKASGSVSVRIQRQGAKQDLDVSLESPPSPDDAKAAEKREEALNDQIQVLRREIVKLRAEIDRLKAN